MRRVDLEKTRTDALNAYEKLRDQVQKWLTAMETSVNGLQSVVVEVDLIKQQADELKPIMKEHRDYSTTIDKVNELGTAYDALLRGDRSDSPRRRPLASSPLKRPSFRASEPRSPSPTKTLSSGFDSRSPMSPSGSSGFGSRISSQEGFLNLDDASPVQQQLNEINQRYNLTGMKLADRQSE
jgi:dystonin